MGMRKSRAFRFAQLMRSVTVGDEGALNTLKVGDASIGSNGSVINLPEDSTIGGVAVPKVDLDIAPEVLDIQIATAAAGHAPPWNWTWEQSTLPYARRAITNSPEITVPLYKQGTYVINNFAKYELIGAMTQTHTLHLKWINGAGTQNNVSWATSTGPVSKTHADINGGTATNVQSMAVNVPTTITIPTLTAPTVTYDITHSSGAYVFSGTTVGSNPNLGPFYRGGTYTININAAGHPLYFTTDNGTNFATGTYFGEYTSGVTGSRTDSGTITFTVPANAPDTLYYQCGNHASMHGAITVKDLAVEVNNNGNYVIYAQHSQEGHAVPVELRPIPSLVNQMCLIYDAAVDKFVPQDLATYVENTPSFKNKIQEVAGTATLVAADGTALVASVKVYDDSTYLPLVGNNPGDLAFATDINSLFAWTGSVWASSKLSDAGGLTTGTLHIDRIANDAITAAKLANSINNEIAANTAKVSNIDHPLVQTAVPADAVFTDTNTTYSVGDGGLSENNFTNADHSKLNAIAASANNYTLPSTLPASMLTGDLPAISGANLTNLPSSGGSSGANLAFGDFSIDHSTGHLNLTWYGEASAGQVFSINNQGKLEVIV